MSSQKIKIKLKSFDHKLVDEACKSIIDAINLTGASLKGPIPLPMRIKKFTVNKSPHVDKKSREQFEIRTYSRLLFVNYATSQTIDTLQMTSLPCGIDVNIIQDIQKI